MKPVLIIIAQLDFQPIEYKDTRMQLEKAGLQVKVASLSTEIAVGKDGSEVQPDIAVDKVNTDDYSGVAIIGGPGATVLAKYNAVLNVVKKFFNQKKIVAAICIAPTVLAAADVLRGKKATVWNNDGLQQKVLERFGATYVNLPVYVDGNIVTANGPTAAKDFGKKVAELLQAGG